MFAKPLVIRFNNLFIMFLELPDFQVIVHWLGIPYIVESSFRGYFIFVTDIIDNELTDYDLMQKILDKFKLLQKNNLIEI